MRRLLAWMPPFLARTFLIGLAALASGNVRLQAGKPTDAQAEGPTTRCWLPSGGYGRASPTSFGSREPQDPGRAANGSGEATGTLQRIRAPRHHRGTLSPIHTPQRSARALFMSCKNRAEWGEQRGKCLSLQNNMSRTLNRRTTHWAQRRWFPREAEKRMSTSNPRCSIDLLQRSRRTGKVGGRRLST